MAVIFPDIIIGKIIKLCLRQNYNRAKIALKCSIRMQERSWHSSFLLQWNTYLPLHTYLYTPTSAMLQRAFQKCMVLLRTEGEIRYCVCFGTHESLEEVTTSWRQGRERAWYLATVPAMGGELDTSGTDHRDNLISSGCSTRAKGDAGTAAEWNPLTPSCPWFPSRSQLLPQRLL